MTRRSVCLREVWIVARWVFIPGLAYCTSLKMFKFALFLVLRRISYICAENNKLSFNRMSLYVFPLVKQHLLWKNSIKAAAAKKLHPVEQNKQVDPLKMKQTSHFSTLQRSASDCDHRKAVKSTTPVTQHHLLPVTFPDTKNFLTILTWHKLQLKCCLWAGANPFAPMTCSHLPGDA